MTWQRRCGRVEDTRRAGSAFADVIEPGDVVLVTGALGAGKTAFVQGLAAGLGVSDRVTSPTFTVVRQHRCGDDAPIGTLHHADLYRTSSVGEIVDLGLGELVEEDAAAIIEWGEMGTSVFGDDVLTIDISVDDEECRTISVAGALSVGREERLTAWASS